jgi:uncharacterized protein YciI
MKNVFVMIVTYTKVMEEVEKHLDAHRAFLAQGFQDGSLMMSGGQNPRIGGVIIGRFEGKAAAEAFVALDPFCIGDVASYEIVEFVPSKFAKELESYLKD